MHGEITVSALTNIFFSLHFQGIPLSQAQKIRLMDFSVCLYLGVTIKGDDCIFVDG